MSASPSRILTWMHSRSINNRLRMIATMAVIMGLVMVVTALISSTHSLSMIGERDETADQAMAAALLEKDFASLERDVARHASMRTAETEDSMRSNFKDMAGSIAETRDKLHNTQSAALAAVEQKTRIYGEAVERMLADATGGPAAMAPVMTAGDDVDAAIEAIRDPVIAHSQVIAAAQVSQAKLTMGVMIAISLIAGIFSYMLTRAVQITINTELDHLRDGIDHIEAGDYSVEFDYQSREDEIGALARAAAGLRNTASAKAIADAEAQEMIDIFGKALKQLADGDLMITLPPLGDSYAGLRQDFNQAVAQLRDALDAVSHAAHAIRTGSLEISAASDDLSLRTERQATQLSETAGTVDALTSGLESTAAEAVRANGSAQDATAEARNGGEIINQSIAAMTNIERSTGEIGNIISVIDGIAFQTNLLALNAGVEAARAGAAGNGFAIVAREVRALAQRSSDAANEIRSLIQKSAGEVSSGAGMVRQAGDALQKIIGSVAAATNLVTRISAEASDQSDKLRRTNQVLGHMDEMTQQNAAMVEESTAAARGLATEADNLTQLVSRFNLGIERGEEVRATPVRHIARQQPVAASHGNLAVAHQPMEEDWDEF